MPDQDKKKDESKIDKLKIRLGEIEANLRETQTRLEGVRSKFSSLSKESEEVENEDVKTEEKPKDNLSKLTDKERSLFDQILALRAAIDEEEKKDKDEDDQEESSIGKGKNGVYTCSKKDRELAISSFEKFEELGFKVKIIDDGNMQFCAIAFPPSYTGNMNPSTMTEDEILKAKECLIEKPGTSPQNVLDKEPKIFAVGFGPKGGGKKLLDFVDSQAKTFKKSLSSNVNNMGADQLDSKSSEASAALPT